MAKFLAQTFYLWSHSGEKPEDILESALIDTGAVFCGNLTLMKVKGDGQHEDCFSSSFWW